MTSPSKMSFGLSYGLVGICLLLAAQSSGQNHELPLTKQPPLVTLDLGKFGFDVRANSKRLRKSIEFTSDGHIAVSWMTFDDSSPSPSLYSAGDRPAHLHALILDSRTGSTIQTQEWASPSAFARFAVIGDGQFLTCIGNVARIFSSTFDLIEQHGVSGTEGCQNDSTWKARGISPNDDSFLKRHGISEITVVGPDGKTIYELRLPENKGFGPAVVSANGDVFAIIQTKLEGFSNKKLDWFYYADDRVVVYRMSDGAPTFSVKIVGESIWHPGVIHRNRLALSFDGSILAVVSDKTLKVYQLPVPSSR